MINSNLNCASLFIESTTSHSPTTHQPRYVYVYVFVTPDTTTKSTTTTKTTPTTRAYHTNQPITSSTGAQTIRTYYTSRPTVAPTDQPYYTTIARSTTNPASISSTTRSPTMSSGNEVDFCSGTGIDCFRCSGCWPGGWCSKDSNAQKCVCQYGWTGDNAVYTNSGTKRNVVRSNNCKRACHYSPFVK